MRRRNSYSGALVIAAIVGCSTGYNRGALDAELRETKVTYVSSDLTVEQIEGMKPQLELPARIAVAPPAAAAGGRWRNASLDTWSPAEVAVIESWLGPLGAAGVASCCRRASSSGATTRATAAAA